MSWKITTTAMGLVLAVAIGLGAFEVNSDRDRITHADQEILVLKAYLQMIPKSPLPNGYYLVLNSSDCPRAFQTEGLYDSSGGSVTSVVGSVAGVPVRACPFQSSP